MRGFAIARPELPVIVINGKDYSQGGRAFTLLHDSATSCWVRARSRTGRVTIPAGARRAQIERFCDAVAAAVLMPHDVLMRFEEVARSGQRAWSDDELRESRQLGTSREALLLRLVTIERTSWDFYMGQRPASARSTGSWRRSGRRTKSRPDQASGYADELERTWFHAPRIAELLRQEITLNEVSSYLGAKLKHIPALEQVAFRVEA